MWSLCSACVCVFLFYCIPFRTCGYWNAPRILFVCPSPSSMHNSFFSQLLEEFWRVYCHFPLPWALELNPELSTSWAEWLNTNNMQPRRNSETQWAWSSWLTCFSGSSLVWLFIYFLSPLPPHPISHSGYAVTAGHFSQPTTTDVVGGAPQDGGIGKVWLFVKQ